MEYAIVDKNGKFIGKTTNELISKIPMPNTFRSDETAIWHDKKWEIKIEEPAKLVISQDGKLDYSPAVAKKFLDLVNKSRNPEKPYDRIFDNSIFSKMKDPKVIHELKTKNCLINDKKYELKIAPKTTQVIISYELSGPCNKKCWYCPQRGRDFTTFSFDKVLENLEEGLDLSISVAKKEDRIIAGQFLGGEITSWDIGIQERIAEIINRHKCSNFGDTIIMTNGTNLNSPVIKKTNSACLIHEVEWKGKKFEKTDNPKDKRMIILTREDTMDDVKRCIDLNKDIKFSWSLDFLSIDRYIKEKNEIELWKELKQKFFNADTGYNIWERFESLEECTRWCEYMTEHEDWQFYIYDRTIKPCYGCDERYRMPFEKFNTFSMEFKCKKHCMPMLWTAWGELL